LIQEKEKLEDNEDKNVRFLKLKLCKVRVRIAITINLQNKSGIGKKIPRKLTIKIEEEAETLQIRD
jgi:hypothetical protein